MTDYKIIHDGYEYNVFIYETNINGITPANSIVYSGEYYENCEFSTDTSRYMGYCHCEIILKEISKFEHHHNPNLENVFPEDFICSCDNY